MITEDALARLDQMIEAHTVQIERLRRGKAAINECVSEGIDQRIERHERWRSIQIRLRDLMARS